MPNVKVRFTLGIFSAVSKLLHNQKLGSVGGPRVIK